MHSVQGCRNFRDLSENTALSPFRPTRLLPVLKLGLALGCAGGPNTSTTGTTKPTTDSSNGETPSESSAAGGSTTGAPSSLTNRGATDSGKSAESSTFEGSPSGTSNTEGSSEASMATTAASDAATETPASDAGAAPQSACSASIPLRCGDRLSQSTIVDGHPNALGAYSCTARGHTGRETVYDFVTESSCAVEIRLSELDVDLDLFSLETCEPFAKGECSSTPLDLQDGERIAFTSVAGTSTFVAVDGYDGAEGTYTLEVDCTCD